jgi:hypothetical protein
MLNLSLDFPRCEYSSMVCSKGLLEVGTRTQSKEI